jgi:hypothetical protein
MSTALTSKRRGFSFWRVLVVLVVLYLGGYFVLMSRNRPAVWDGGKGEGRVAAFSSFRWASQWHGKPVYSTWNDIFKPLDKIYFSVFPSAVTMETRYE